MSTTQLITSRDNPLVQRLRKHAQDPSAYRKLGEVWLEGDHLCSACLARGVPVALAVIADTAWLGEHGMAAGHDELARKLSELARRADKVVVVPQALWKVFSGLESHAHLGFLLSRPEGDAAGSGIRSGLRSVVLDRVQDAGNVGSILRSASAMGFEQVVALKGTAALWSPKVLRAGMGAHFALHLVEQVVADDLAALAVPMVATSSHTDQLLPTAPLPDPCAWVLGHEGQGVAEAVMARCALKVAIPQPGGEESLNVAAAAAVCLYESLRRRQPA
ncbi:MAG: RNA methyltransferase [Aquabacterium sp.]|uniref:TrmH family RNA methyltransferase n=1 Tax=Aquabacterium sp. TaxID=1872578 RepID=UPI0025BEBA9B|nr:RNA methyltransferase [Aquabacterium sp.]MBI3383109.1 RNA methyltransferase [Aquabacterium sp.]